MMLMAWGPFRFTVPNYSVETISRSLSPRMEEQPIIGAAPLLHRLGPGAEEITLSSTFHPRHFNGRGLSQLAGVREAVNAQLPLHLVHINGAGQNIFGMWLATSISNEETTFDNAGTPQTVTVSLKLKRYDQSAARMAALSLSAGGISLSLGVGSSGSFSASLRLGF
ncbi:phage tail protein [Brucella tritici]|uniref:Phage tail protein n=3 Tax=Brucella/Ochrobactrum group TaxID=2826938 RepID=A0A833FR22_9HYPH|nr:phage tail protein [Brucella tritici]